MLEMIVVGALTALSLVLLLCKLNIRRFLWMQRSLDVLFHVGFALMFAGTLGGMIAAVVAGLILSVVLWVLRRSIGYERPRFHKGRVAWERVPPHEGKAR